LAFDKESFCLPYCLFDIIERGKISESYLTSNFSIKKESRESSFPTTFHCHNIQGQKRSSETSSGGLVDFKEGKKSKENRAPIPIIIINLRK